MSATRRRSVHLRLDTFEDRVIPSIGTGVNVTSLGSNGIPAVGNSGAIGPDHYVQFQVGNFLVYDRTGALVSQVADTTFWTDAGLSSTLMFNGLAMPRVTYDVLTQRWYAIELTLDGSNNQILVGWSDTADPTGGWSAFNYTGVGGGFASFPTLGVDVNGVYVGTANFAHRDLPSPTGSTLTAVPKSELFNPVDPPNIGRSTFTQSGTTVPMGWAPQVATNFDPNATTASVVATHYTLFNRIVRTPLTWSFPAGQAPVAALGTSSNLTTTNTSLPGKSRQPDGTRQISGGDDDRYTGAIYQVGDLIYAAHTISVNSSGTAQAPSGSTTNAVHLVVLSASQNAVVTETKFFNSSYDYTFPSVAANTQGDVVMVFNRSGLNTTDGQLGAYATYAKIDPANPAAGLTFGQPIELAAGQTNGYHQQGSTLEAWGPNSAIALDPTDPFAFWATAQYAQTDSAWATQVSQIFVAPKALSAGTSAANGVYGVGAQVPITVTFSAPVEVTGDPKLNLNSGGTATYTGGTGTTTLTFTYTVAAGNSTNEGLLDYVSVTPFDLTGGSIVRAGSSLVAVLILPAPGSPGSLSAAHSIVIDTVVPSVTGVAAGVPNGTYGFQAQVPIQVTFSRPVTATGNPVLALNTGATAVLTGGSGTNTLTFTYTVRSGDFTPDLDYTSIGALTGGTIQDAVNGSVVTPVLPQPGGAGSLGANANIVIDAVGALVLGVTSPTADGLYTVGAVIHVTVRFDKVVTVTGVPQLALNSGGAANYHSGSGTDTLTFQYLVGGGHNAADLDYSSTTALTLNGGTIEAGGLGANLTLPPPGSLDSLGGSKAIAIDTAGPTVVDYKVVYGRRTYSLFGSTRVNLPWLVTGVQVVFSEPVPTANVRSLTGFSAIRLTGKGTTTLTWKFRGVGRGMFNTTLANSGANAIKDKAGNVMPAFGQAFNVLWGDFTDDGVVDAADEAGVRALQGGPYQPGTVNYNPFADLSGDGLVNLIDVGITRTRRGTRLP